MYFSELYWQPKQHSSLLIFCVSAPPGFLNMSGQQAQQSYLPLDNGHHHHHTPPVMNAPSHTIINVNTQPSKSVVFVGGGCPSCRVCDFTNILRIVNNLYAFKQVGVLSKSHCTFCGILWSILLFPIGLLCLCCCTKDRCSNCSYTQN